MRLLTGTAVAVALLVALGACTADDGSGKTVKDARGGSSSTTKDTPADDPPSPKPDGKYTSDCDYALGDFSSNTSSGFRFIADAHLHNTGNVGLVMLVKAQWSQVGTKPVVRTKRLRIGVGKRATAHFTVPVGQNEIDLIQSVSSGRDCKVSASMVDTYGQPQG